MKKLFLVFLLVAQGAIGAFGQYLVSPIKKVIPDHNYTVSELKDFINSDDPIVGPWCETFLGLVQDGLTKCNEDLFIVKGHGGSKETVLSMINDYCVETKRDLPAGFTNSGKTLQNTIKFVVDKRDFKNMVFLTFKFGSCEKDIVKMNCFNEPDLPERKIIIVKKDPDPKPKPEEVVEHRLQDFKFETTKESSDEEIIVVKKQHGKFITWVKDHPIATGLITGGIITGVGFVAHDSNHNWYLWFPKSNPHGTMSNGRGDVTTNGTGTQDGGRGD